MGAVCREQCASLRPVGQHSQELLQRQGTLHAEERQVDQVSVPAVQGCPQCPLLLAQAQQQWHLQHGIPLSWHINEPTVVDWIHDI